MRPPLPTILKWSLVATCPTPWGTGLWYAYMKPTRMGTWKNQASHWAELGQGEQLGALHLVGAPRNGSALVGVFTYPTWRIFGQKLSGCGSAQVQFTAEDRLKEPVSRNKNCQDHLHRFRDFGPACRGNWLVPNHSFLTNPGTPNHSFLTNLSFRMLPSARPWSGKLKITG